MTLSTQERFQLQQQDLYFLQRPLVLGPEPHSMAAHLRHMVKLLRDPGTASPSSAAITYLTELYDRSVPPRPDIACRKGCSHCCCQPVLITAPEALLVAAQIRDRADMRLAVADAQEKLALLAADRPWHDWVRCPLLEDAACSIYAARPLACHFFVSTKLESCLTAFVDHGPPDIPMPADNISLLYACRMMLYAAHTLIGVRSACYEMNKAVTVLLALDNAEARWLGGEDVLAGLEDKTPVPPQFDKEISRIAAWIAPTL
jgi:Fe-S-cluster containining protein